MPSLLKEHLTRNFAFSNHCIGTLCTNEPGKIKGHRLISALFFTIIKASFLLHLTSSSYSFKHHLDYSIRKLCVFELCSDLVSDVVVTTSLFIIRCCIEFRRSEPFTPPSNVAKVPLLPPIGWKSPPCELDVILLVSVCVVYSRL